MDARYNFHAPSTSRPLWGSAELLFEISSGEASNVHIWPKFVGRKTVFIASLADAALELVRAIPIRLERYSDGWVAYSYDLDEIAIGPDESSALDDMRNAIVDSYNLLIEQEAFLGPLQQRHLVFLKQVVRETGV